MKPRAEEYWVSVPSLAPIPQMTVTSLEVMYSHNQVQIDLKDIDLNRLRCGPWRRAQWVKLLSQPHKHRDLSSDPVVQEVTLRPGTVFWTVDCPRETLSL